MRVKTDDDTISSARGGAFVARDIAVTRFVDVVFDAAQQKHLLPAQWETIAPVVSWCPVSPETRMPTLVRESLPQGIAKVDPALEDMRKFVADGQGWLVAQAKSGASQKNIDAAYRRLGRIEAALAAADAKARSDTKAAIVAWLTERNILSRHKINLAVGARDMFADGHKIGDTP